MRRLLFAFPLLLVACQSTQPGDLCPDAGSCGSGLTCEGGQDFPDGACTKACTPGKNGDCPGSSLCAAMASGNWCLTPCTGASSCRSDQVCGSANLSQKVCLPKPEALAAASPSCAPPQVVVPGGFSGPAADPGACQQPVVASTLPAEQTVHLGVHTVGDHLTFDLPADSTAITIVSQAVSANSSVTYQGTDLENVVFPTQVRDPSNTVLFDDQVNEPADPTTANVVFRNFSAGISAFAMPNTSHLLSQDQAAGLETGTWNFTLEDFSDECTQTPSCTGGATHDTYDLTVWHRPGPLADQGTLDVAIYWVTAGAITAANAADNASVKRMLSTLESFYANVGLCLGTVTFYDVAPWAVAKYASGVSADKTLPCDDLSQLFTLGSPGNQINLFFVDDISSTDTPGGAHIEGLDGTIPGPSGFSGTVNGGAIVSMADLTAGSCGSKISLTSCGADATAYIAAHEAGHWLGLYHVTERNGESFDPLVDTPNCKCESCVGNASHCSNDFSSTSTLVVGANCIQGSQLCSGAENLMFWLLDGTSQGSLTPEQGQLMRLNPAVH